MPLSDLVDDAFEFYLNSNRSALQAVVDLLAGEPCLYRLSPRDDSNAGAVLRRTANCGADAAIDLTSFQFVSRGSENVIDSGLKIAHLTPSHPLQVATDLTFPARLDRRGYQSNSELARRTSRPLFYHS